MPWYVLAILVQDDIRQGLNETVESMSHTLIVPRDSHDVKLLDESSEASDGEHPLPTVSKPSPHRTQGDICPMPS